MTTSIRQHLSWQQVYHTESWPGGYAVALRPDGVEVAMAQSVFMDETGEHELHSPVFELVRAADPRPTPSLLGAPVSIRDALSPEAAAERMAAYAIARHSLKPNQRSPRDMERIARELAHDAKLQEHAYQLRKERLLARRAASDQAVAFLLELNPEFISPEQRAQLGKLLTFLLTETEEKEKETHGSKR